MSYTRMLSYSELSAALTCWARHDFAYGGHLAGSTLKPKQIDDILSEGRAWGVAVATWHANAHELLAGWIAHAALRESLKADAEKMAQHGLPPTPDRLLEIELRLGAMLDHYIATTDPLPNLTMIERELIVPIPSRGGRHASTRYRFQCFLDGYTVIDGNQHLVEFKLRNSLTPPPLLVRQRQHLWYAWALARSQGDTAPVGAIVDERLNAIPEPPRTIKGPKGSRKPSHAKNQHCTPESYVQLCHEFGEEPNWEVLEHLRQRRWQQRVPILFRPDELDQAGRELRDGAKLIRDLDAGVLYPVRNATRANCGYCRFEPICSEPGDSLYVETLFERTIPKRDRTEELA